MIPVFERAETIHHTRRAAAVIEADIYRRIIEMGPTEITSK
jgi:hypothetical protein